MVRELRITCSARATYWTSEFLDSLISTRLSRSIATGTSALCPSWKRRFPQNAEPKKKFKRTSSRPTERFLRIHKSVFTSLSERAGSRRPFLAPFDNQRALQMQRRIRFNELVVVSGGFTDRASGTIQIFHTEPLMCPQPGEEAMAAPIDDTKTPFEIVKISELSSGKAAGESHCAPRRLCHGDGSGTCLHHGQRGFSSGHFPSRPAYA